ncbi:hypothetical protein [Pedobacter sp. ASV28]|uniref:hypothetical protein n=1 Tax=Pedobacter sp. ASV28 TaxID=2795123 RepID=UPI0018EBAE78|nr:hypothetical protein [Pedobacter sp. ASV28]
METFRSYFRDGYILFTKSINHNYDVLNGKDECSISYSIVKIEEKILKIMNADRAESILKEKFAGIKL